MTLTAEVNESGPVASPMKRSEKVLIAFLVISFVMPFYFFLGGLRLSMYRIYLLIFAIPIVIWWVRGDAGKIRATDVFVILASFWMVISLLVVHGAEKAEFAGITVIETLIPYLAARVFIRDYERFKHFIWCHFIVIACLLPFAILEGQNGEPILINAFRGIFSVYVDAQHAPRLGLHRAQASMPHPILFGVFASPAFAFAWYVLGSEGSSFKRILRPIIAGATAFTSLSSAALMAVVLQLFLMAWDRILISVKSRWIIFGVIFGVIYIVLELASNRNAFQIIATELSFSSGTAYNRILIFNHAVDDVARNPVFGIGLNDWTRPEWMKPSIDNFWLVLTMRHGLPMLTFMVLAILLLFIQVIRKPLTGKIADARMGYLIVLASLALCASTVHFWDSTYCLLMFLLGSGAWFLDHDSENEGGTSFVSDEPNNVRSRIRYTRFAKKQAASANGYSRFTRS